jgi:5-methylcytosine-specific restriction protein B
MKKISGIVWRRCGDADLRALLGRGGGHNVIAFGAPAIWEDYLHQSINSESNGGTVIPIEPEPVGAAALSLTAYLHEGRNEVRIKVPPILAVGSSLTVLAQSNAETLDPDGGAKGDDLVAFVVQTSDERYHLRGCLLSSLEPPVRDWVATQSTGGRTFDGVAIGDREQQIMETLIKHKSVLLYGPSGTGKTWTMLQIRHAFERGIDEISFHPGDLQRPFHLIKAVPGLPSNRVTEFVTFHQSLTYESFVVGLHPKPNEGGPGGITFASKDGIFLKLAEHALKEDAASLLLIDEINRGNVADILGELITVLEDDKRLAPNGQSRYTTVTVTLPLKPERLEQKFRMPNHFYLLASMNSLDRSVAPLDSALRRRFRLVNVKPDLNLARKLMLGGRDDVTLQNPDDPSPEECKSIALALLRKLNDGIRAVLGPEFQMGHSYILSITDGPTLMDAVADVVFPQLYELFRDRPRDLLELIGEDLVTLSEAMGEIGLGLPDSVPAELVDVRELSIGRLMRTLYRLSSGAPWSEPEPLPAPNAEE